MNAAQAYPNILMMVLDEKYSKVAPTSDIDGSEESPVERLTEREEEIAAFVAKGLSNPQIARELVISDRTVQTHVANILNKRGLRNRQEIAVWFSQRETLRKLG